MPSPDLHVLVLDDDEIMLVLLDALLSADGMRVTLAASGEDALQLLPGLAPLDVVLSDLQMPGLQGGALARRLRAAMPRSALLLGMSASEPTQEISALFDAFLPKPFDIQLLRDAIQTATRRKVQEDTQDGPMAATPSQTAESTVALLDEKVFQSLRKMISASQLQDLFTMALADITKRHDHILAAAAAGDLGSAQRQAHAIKGSCGMIGAAELQELAAAIEDGTTFNMSAISEIPSACLRLQRMLETKLQAV